MRTFLAFPEWFYLKEPVNTMTPPRRTPGGLATQFSSAGHFDLGPDQAMIVTVPAASKDVAPYQGIQLGSMWYISLDYINHQTSLTADQARADSDGMLRFVISEQDPGVANWLELTGRTRGYVQIRWQRLSQGPRRGRRPAGLRWSRLPDLAAGCRTTSRPDRRRRSTGHASPRARPQSRTGWWASSAVRLVERKLG